MSPVNTSCAAPKSARDRAITGNFGREGILFSRIRKLSPRPSLHLGPYTHPPLPARSPAGLGSRKHAQPQVASRPAACHSHPNSLKSRFISRKAVLFSRDRELGPHGHSPFVGFYSPPKQQKNWRRSPPPNGYSETLILMNSQALPVMPGGALAPPGNCPVPKFYR
jgi:hypothetical protein